MTSLSESYSMTLAESKMFGLPAVIYDLPYIDLSKKEFGTISVPQQDVKAAATEIIRLFSSNDYAKEQSTLSYNAAEWLINYDLSAEWSSAIKYLSCGSNEVLTPIHDVKSITNALFFHYLLSCNENAKLEKKASNSTPAPILFDKSAEYQAILNSKSYKIGRFITYIPRKISGGIRCYKENGMRYTLRRIREKFASLFKK